MAKSGEGVMPTYTAEQFIKAIPGTGGVIGLLADNMGCKWHTAKKYVTEYATVKAAWEDECNRVTDRAKHNLIKAIHGGDLQISKWWMQVKDPEFRPKQGHKLSGSVGIQIIGIDPDAED